MYEQIKAIHWEDYLDIDKTFAVDAVVFSEEFRHSKFVSYKVKDAIVDYFRDAYDKRPSVRISKPDVLLNIHIAETKCTLSLDSSGESLHRRGYRQEAVEAPLNEVLAAGMILMSGWHGECDLIDPMCGSGTIPIEAALIARNIAPGVFRKEFAFEKWIDFDQELFDKIYNDDSQEREFAHKIYGYDNNPKANEIATHNIKAAGVSKSIPFFHISRDCTIKKLIIMSKKALLMILDGWGIGDQGKDDVIFNTPTPYWDSLLATYPHSELQASGENVGLPDGQMGNSEVGHLNIGAGRIVYQDLVKINRACADGSILKNKEIVSAFSYAKEHGKNIHFMGLTSNGGVHSSFDHLFKLCDISKEYGIENTFIHCFMDGRDTDPKSGKGFIEQLTAHCEKSAGKIASIVGRFYAMDRDKRWERVKVAYDLLVNGEGKVASDMVQAMQESYDEGVTDEFIKPIVNANFDGTIKEGDVVIFFNYRNDRAKELTIVLTQQDMPEQGMHTIPGFAVLLHDSVRCFLQGCAHSLR